MRVVCLLSTVLFFGCAGPVVDQNNQKDTVAVHNDVVKDSVLVLDTAMVIVKDMNHLNKDDSMLANEILPDSVQHNERKIEIRTFPNNEAGGYGYDVLIDGKIYVHQPTIPAVQGNRGFPSELLARKTGQLIIKKINQNIMPPTISIGELDSLGIR